MSTDDVPALTTDLGKARPARVRRPSPEDPVVAYMAEHDFLGRWYRAAYRGDPAALEIVQHVPPEVLQRQYFREAYTYLGELVAKGESLSNLSVEHYLLQLAQNTPPNGMDDYAVWGASYMDAESEEALRESARKVVSGHRGRAQADILNGAASLTRDAMREGHSVRKVADELIDRLVSLHSRLGEQRGPRTQEEIAQHLLKKLESGNTHGYNWPWPKLQHALGVIAPGKVYGVSGYSGGGKTLFVCNLFRELVLRGVPVIVFPTEMDLQWLERVVATLARVPKEYAEEGDWRRATQDDMARYRNAMRMLVGLQWDIVQQSGISPAEMLARTRVLRRKYRGQHVIVIADHMHRLDYPSGVSADDAQGAGKATADQKNMARSDKEGGLTWIDLYQPVKPEDEEKQFRPVLGHKIRGHGSSFNEVDVHISVWRRVVKCTPTMKTEWGTPMALYDKEHDALPSKGNYGEKDTKVDDEHVYLTCDKHRIRGPTLETTMLNIHAPSGFIYEHDWLHETLAKATNYDDDPEDGD